MNYTIEGAPLPVVICNLEGGETMLTEKGAMSWMSPNMKMETTTGGGIGKMFGRAFSGESMFINRYTAQGGTGLIAFASSFPGDIRAFEIAPGQEITGYLAAMTAGCSINIQTVPGVKNMLFGGEGIFNTVITGPGRVWLQSMPVAQLAGAISPFIPNKN